MRGALIRRQAVTVLSVIDLEAIVRLVTVISLQDVVPEKVQ